MDIAFEALVEDRPGPQWLTHFRRQWSGYKAWYLQHGLTERASHKQCLRNLNTHMPEFVPVYQALCDLVGGGDVSQRFLSLYRPPAYVGACSQLATQSYPAVLLRNYDYSPLLFDGLILNSCWLEKRVLGVTDCLIGLLDGINSDGLCVSLAFGGSRKVGRGFGIPLIIRYVLETCATLAEARAALIRLPSHMAYNVTVLDRSGQYLTVYMRPGGGNQVLDGRGYATNHQTPEPEWPSYCEATHTYERADYLHNLAHISNVDLLDRFLRAPLLADRYKAGQGTLYTALYDPSALHLSLYWLGRAPLHLPLYDMPPHHFSVHYEDASTPEEGSAPSGTDT